MIIFIVPYRNREGELQVFLSHMRYLLEDISDEDYRIYIIHQDDERPFNRGAMRNIGFLMGKKEFPTTYKEIDYVFHDLDNLIAIKNSVEFTTNENEVNHIFGNYKNINIGGIFVMKGCDYEKVNGYPNFWGWGHEDNCLGLRIREKGLNCLRKYFHYYDKRIIHLNNVPYLPALRKVTNSINEDIFTQRAKRGGQSINDGIHSIRDLKTNKKHIFKNIIQWNVTDFKVFLSADAYKKKEIWILSHDFSTWLQENKHKFRP